METKSYDSIKELVEELPEYGCIHIECNREKSEELLAFIVAQKKKGTDN